MTATVVSPASMCQARSSSGDVVNRPLRPPRTRRAKLASSTVGSSIVMAPRRERRDRRAQLGQGQVLADATARAEPEREQRAELLRRIRLVPGRIEAQRLAPCVRVTIDRAEVHRRELTASDACRDTRGGERDAGSARRTRDAPHRGREPQHLHEERPGRTTGVAPHLLPLVRFPRAVDDSPRQRRGSGLVAREEEARTWPRNSAGVSDRPATRATTQRARRRPHASCRLSRSLRRRRRRGRPGGASCRRRRPTGGIP